MDEQTIAAFLDELEEIEKVAFRPLSFLASGVRRIGGALSGVGKGGVVKSIGGKGAERAGGIGKHIQQIYQAGAAKGGRGMLGGLGAVARSRYGQMAAVPLLAGGGLYAGKKILGGGSQQQQYR